MKAAEREIARHLRQQGCSLNEILQQVDASESTLSLWVRDIQLTTEQIERLREKISNRAAGRELFRQAMRARRDARWAQYQQEAVDEYQELSQDPQFMFGLALYIGEGHKCQHGLVAVVNCEAGVIAKSLEFFERIGVSKDKVTVTIHLHPGLCENEARKYWQQITGLPLTQFRKTIWVVSRASARKKGHLQIYGTCRIAVHSTKLRQKLGVWMKLALYGTP